MDGIGGGIGGKWDVNQWTGYTVVMARTKVRKELEVGEDRLLGQDHRLQEDENEEEQVDFV